MVKITVATPSVCDCVAGALQEIGSQTIDESAYPDSLTMMFFVGAAMLANPTITDQLPKREDDSPIVTPDTVKVTVTT